MSPPKDIPIDIHYDGSPESEHPFKNVHEIGNPQCDKRWVESDAHLDLALAMLNEAGFLFQKPLSKLFGEIKGTHPRQAHIFVHRAENTIRIFPSGSKVNPLNMIKCRMSITFNFGDPSDA